MPFYGRGTSPLTLVASSTLGGAAASIDISSIPSGFKGLLVHINVQTASDDTIKVRLNADATANAHNWNWLLETGSAESHGNSGAGDTYWMIGSCKSDKSATIQLQISNDAALKKSFNSVSGTFLLNFFGSGYWNSTAEINRLTFVLTGAGNMSTGTSVQVYGY